jgi:hypothetical protein
MHRCHCEKPADWLLLAFPHTDEIRSAASWAVCDAHLAEAARWLDAGVVDGSLTRDHRPLPTNTFNIVIRRAA